MNTPKFLTLMVLAPLAVIALLAVFAGIGKVSVSAFEKPRVEAQKKVVEKYVARLDRFRSRQGHYPPSLDGIREGMAAEDTLLGDMNYRFVNDTAFEFEILSDRGVARYSSSTRSWSEPAK